MMVSPDVAKYNLHPYGIVVLPTPLAVLATIAISVRIWIRCFFTRSFGRDDVCLILAYVSASCSFLWWLRQKHQLISRIQICFLAACGDFIAIGITECQSGLDSIVRLAEVSHTQTAYPI